uniref:B30.2/SPRY domain-containing protein n=1 Tax=Tetraodon nigroviridis TaxID=99883 RepID=H3BXT5_TETNG
CELTLDTNTLNRKLQLSDGARTVRFVETEQPYPDHPDRFQWWPQVLCSNGLTGRSYWEVACEGRAFVAVSYPSIRRAGEDGHCEFGENDHSWRLNCYGGRYSVCHNSTTTSIRVAVYVDWPAGLLSFYIVGADSLIHLKTFNTTFSEPLHPGFGFWFWPGSSVSLFPAG